MAIDIIPGVGPTNADIATAVAAPSAATIAAAVAAPSAATIAAAVAAPSAATIATQVAASVPTSANITSIVQANAGSPFGGTWTNIGSATFSGGASATISGLGSYKYLRFSIVCTHAAAHDVYMRINGDTGSNYFYMSSINEGYNNSGGLYANANSSGTYFQIGNASVFDGTSFLATLEIFGAQSGAHKTLRGTSIYKETTYGLYASYSLDGTWRNTAAVTSFTVYNSRTSALQGTIWAQGAN